MSAYTQKVAGISFVLCNNFGFTPTVGLEIVHLVKHTIFSRAVYLGLLQGSSSEEAQQILRAAATVASFVGRFFFSHLLSQRAFSFSFSLPRRDSHPGSLSRLFSPLPDKVVPSFLTRGRNQSFLPSSTRMELRLPTLLGAYCR